jgi:hypothetical protein
MSAPAAATISKLAFICGKHVPDPEHGLKGEAMKRILFPILSFAALSAAAPQPAPTPTPTPTPLGARLAEVQRFSRSHGEKLWPGFGSAPFGFLLVEAGGETLLCQGKAPAGFAPAGKDEATGCDRFTRSRSGLPDRLLAAMPVFGPPSTIVMGTPQATGYAEPDWLRTILHEHFHQWQAALPNYYGRVNALDLKGGDETGMWMLNFPFPYADPKAGEAYASASRTLAAALESRGKRGFRSAFTRYLAARQAFETTVGPRNWRYLELQLWQEGVARWTEIELGRAYPDAAVRLSAFKLEALTLQQLRTPELKKQGRELAYPMGAGEAMLLHTCGSAWRTAYRQMLALGPLLKAARANCRGSVQAARAPIRS